MEVKKKRNYLHIRWVEIARKVYIFRPDLATVVRYHEKSIVHVSRRIQSIKVMKSFALEGMPEKIRNCKEKCMSKFFHAHSFHINI